jgi:NAD(P)-dependent dehydrogenase (short-subunit alcohol dehydrogenase family)
MTSTSGAKPLSDRIALITGASRGIGRAAALALSAAGAHVVLAARTVGGLEEVDDEIRATGGSATLVPLDLRHAEKLDALGPSLYERWGRIDIVVGNAGVLGRLSPVPHIPTEVWAEVIDVNLTANFRLIRSLHPLLRKSDAGRAIFVSSGASGANNAYWGPYAASKAGLEALVKTYAREIESTSIRANIINPGPIRTGMRAQAFPGENPATLKTPEDIAPLFVTLASPSCTDNGRVFDFKTGAVR